MKTICRRLRRGDDLLRSIEQIAREEGLEAAVIVSGVGCVSHARVRDASGVTVREIGEPCDTPPIKFLPLVYHFSRRNGIKKVSAHPIFFA